MVKADIPILAIVNTGRCGSKGKDNSPYNVPEKNTERTETLSCKEMKPVYFTDGGKAHGKSS